MTIRGPHDEVKFEKYVDALIFREYFCPLVFSQKTTKVLLPIVPAWSTRRLACVMMSGTL
jgi:hypothetical protein